MSSLKEILGLPEGVKIKMIREGYDEVSERSERITMFPVGYVEPRHEHDHYHSIFILEGTMLVDGKTLGPGDYVFGGGPGNATETMVIRSYYTGFRWYKPEITSMIGIFLLIFTILCTRWAGTKIGEQEN